MSMRQNNASWTKMAFPPFLVFWVMPIWILKKSTQHTSVTIKYISSWNFTGMCIRSIQYARYNNGCFSFFFSELWPFYCLCFCKLILCNFHSCTPHNSLINLDIVMKFNWNMYQVKMICSAQALLFPFLLDFKLCPLNLFSFFSKVLVCLITW